MSLDPQELELFIALQGVIKEKMGEWQVGDRWYNYRLDLSGFIYDEEKAYEFNEVNDIDDICLPLPIDPSGQGRGLIDMINRHYNLFPALPKYGGVFLKVGADEFYAATPALALLKAIAAQDNVEVKG